MLQHRRGVRADMITVGGCLALQGVQIPHRIDRHLGGQITGAHKGELAWMPLQHWRVLRTLHNPRYAGAFAYGRGRERLNSNGKKTFDTLPREQWIALTRDAHPGYISWDTYETNQRLLLANATAHGPDRAAGPAREGSALLQGLAICGRCGRRMTVRYHARRGVEVPDYQCMNRCIQDGVIKYSPMNFSRRPAQPACQALKSSGSAITAPFGQALMADSGHAEV